MQNGNWRDTQKLNRAISAKKIAKGSTKPMSVATGGLEPSSRTLRKLSRFEKYNRRKPWPEFNLFPQVFGNLPPGPAG